MAPASTRGRAGHAGCPSPEPRGRASDRGAGRRSGERGPASTRAARRCRSTGWAWHGGVWWEGGSLGFWVPPAWGGGRAWGWGLPAASVSQCGCLNGEVAVRPSTALLLASFIVPRPRLRPLPTPAVPTGILFGGVLAAREHLLPGSTPQVRALRGTCPSCAPCSREPWPPRGAGFSAGPCLSS